MFLSPQTIQYLSKSTIDIISSELSDREDELLVEMELKNNKLIMRFTNGMFMVGTTKSIVDSILFIVPVEEIKKEEQESDFFANWFKRKEWVESINELNLS